MIIVPSLYGNYKMNSIIWGGYIVDILYDNF